MSITAKFVVLPLTLSGDIHASKARITRAELEITLLLEHKVKPVSLGLWKGDIARNTVEKQTNVHSYSSVFTPTLANGHNWKSFANVTKEKIPLSCCSNAKVQVESKISGVRRYKSEQEDWCCKSYATISLATLLAVDGEPYEVLLPLAFTKAMTSANTKIPGHGYHEQDTFLHLRMLCSTSPDLCNPIPKIQDFQKENLAVNVYLENVTINGEYLCNLVTDRPKGPGRLNNFSVHAKLSTYTADSSKPKYTGFNFFEERLETASSPSASKLKRDKWAQISASPFRWARTATATLNQGIVVPVGSQKIAKATRQNNTRLHRRARLARQNYPRDFCCFTCSFLKRKTGRKSPFSVVSATVHHGRVASMHRPKK
eukprot:gb/GECG01005721.1/.p1 GENE.gb/GECG01005721.1/~~gb/GECG01005721.1/.p1  ORF type:complete len:372 (+),score=30.54 gb/GECG01005721.1/:1-1116(+)